MGLEVIAAIAAVVGTVSSISSQMDAKKAAGRSAEEQRKAQNEQRAVASRQAAEEKRKQVREERVRRAKILQGAENTGTEGSSGEAGALGSLATQLSSNIGSNIGAARSGALIGGFNQSAADFSFDASKSMQEAGQWSQLAGIGGNIFEASGGFSKTKTASDPFTDFYLKGNSGSGD
jgi:hypothetical protein